MTTSAPDRERTQERTSVLSDVLSGAIAGDFSKQLGPAGALTQMVLGFVPVLGTLTALRDLLADLSTGDGLGVLLNLIALIPVLGGFAKTAEVLHHLRRLHASIQRRNGHNGSAPTRPAISELAGEPHTRRGANFYSLLSVLLGVAAPILSPALAFYGLTSLAPAQGWTDTTSRLAVLLVTVFTAPLLGIILGHLGSRRARRVHGAHSPRPMARIGLALGYIYLFGFAAALALVLMGTHIV
jgi:hypothetical protein